MSQLKIQNISHHYDNHPILKDITLSLKQGEMLAILGASGSGKTTLLRALAGFINPQRGSITIGDQVVTENGTNRVIVEDRNIGMVFQDHALFPQMSVKENIIFGIHERADRHERCETLLQLVNMQDFAHRFPHTLSGGQQQRIALARALAPQPQILLLDEPFANLDANLRHTMALEVKTILKSTNTTAVMVTHDKNDALNMADQLAILDTPNTLSHSSLVQCDTPTNVYAHPVSEVAANLTGSCTCIPAQAQNNIAISDLGEIALQNDLTGPCRVVLRPENIIFTENMEGPNTITHKSYLGSSLRWTASTPCGDVHFHTQTNVDIAIGQQGCFSYKQPCWAFND